MRQNTTPTIRASLAAARRLVVTKQRLGEHRRPAASKDAVVALVRDLAYLQLDPVSVVAPALDLELWSRFGPFRRSDIEELRWKDKRLFEYCAHALALVPMEDYPIHYSIMRRYPESLSSGWGAWRAHARRWLPAHRNLRSAVLRRLRGGPQRVSDFPTHAATRRAKGGWSSGSDVSAMLFHLQMSGEVTVVGYDGNQKLWGLAREFLPSWADRTVLPQEELERRAAQRALRAQGLATPPEIKFYFPRGCYLDLPGALSRLEDDSLIHRVEVVGVGRRTTRYVHDADLSLLEALEAGPLPPRVELLSPFDNLICARGRVRELFGFDYFHENYIPKEKRRFGVYVLPILYGERFIGRIDPKVDRARRRLVVNAVYAERGAPSGREVAQAVGDRIGELASFLGMEGVEYAGAVPAIWRDWLS